MKVRVTLRALQDVNEAAQWYASIDMDLRNALKTSLDEAIGLISKFPLAGSKLRDKYRRVHLKRFPYSLTYLVSKETIYILKLTHHKREEDYP